LKTDDLSAGPARSFWEITNHTAPVPVGQWFKFEFFGTGALNVRVPTKPAMHSNLKPAGYSDRKPATLGVNRMGRFDDVVEG
jgi:hypothetical protein